MHSKRLQTITAMLAITALCTMILALLVYHITAESLKQEITNAYHVSLLHTRDRMETYIRQLDQITLQFEKIPEVESFIQQADGDIARERIDAITIVSMMQRIHASLEYVDNVVVYDVRSRVLYATNSVMNPVYADYLPVFSEFASRNVKRAFLNMEVEGIPTTVYIKKMPAFHQIQPVYIVFHINQSIYDDFLGEGRYSDAGSYFIVNGDGRLMSSRGTADADDLLSWTNQINLMKASLPETGVGSFTLADAYVTFLPLSYDGWVYAFGIPNEVFLHQLYTLRNVILTVSVLLFVASVILSVLSSHWLWRGWYRIRTILDDPSVQTGDKRSNEFDMMYSKIQTVVEQSRMLRHQMDEIMPTVQDTVMLTVLEEGVRTHQDWDRVRRYNIPLREGAYACLCVEMDLDKENESYSERDRSIFEYAIISVMREVIGSSGFAVRTDRGGFAAVINDEKLSHEALQPEVTQMAERIHHFIGQYFPMNVSIGVSRTRHNLNHLNLAYREARELLYNRLIVGGNKVFTFEPMDEGVAGDPFPVREVENDILYGIRTRNAAFAYASVEQLNQVRTIPNVQYRWLQSKLIETAQSICRQIGKSLPPTERWSEPTVDELLQLSTLDDWLEWFRHRCIDPLVTLLSEQYDQQAASAVALVTDYIKQHIEADPKLEACCKELQIPVSMARQSLKEKLGITFNELVLRERIVQAQEWLASSTMSVEEIARKLQYSNAQNFSRTFKKAVGIPPGQYRTQVTSRRDSSTG